MQYNIEMIIVIQSAVLLMGLNSNAECVRIVYCTQRRRDGRGGR